MSLKNIVCHFFVFCWVIYSVDTVSFYGESHIHIPLHDAFRETDLELRFKASRPYGVLFLLAGRADYFLLQLYAGTVQLKVDYGVAETRLDLGDHRYDDLQWHEVKVTSRSNSISLTVDGQTVEKDIVGEFRELSIDSGAYLGGIDGTVTLPSEERLKNFRGAFSKVKFNDMDLIEMARTLTDPGNLVEISWDIDEIFDSPRSTAIALKSETSFFSFSHIHPRQERTVSMLVQTESQTAILLFSYTHHSVSKHFIALEIINGLFRLTVCKGEETLRVESDETVIPSTWYQLDLSVTSTKVDLVVNGEWKSETFKDRSGAVYGGLLYFGGINQKGRVLVISEGLESMSGENSYRGGIVGCIKDVLIDSRVYNLYDIHASRLIGAGCSLGEKCVGGICNTPRLEQLKPHSDSNNQEKQILSVNPLYVQEGGRTEITSHNIEIVYDFKDYGIRQSAIMIHIVGPPKFGDIEVDLGRRRTSSVFTYLDLTRGKVAYIHGGLEQYSDEVSMEIEIYTNRRFEQDIPEKLQQRYAFVLPIVIKPMNDPARIIVSNNGYLKLIANTKIRITNDFLSADDPDTPLANLKYFVVKPPTVGYFEKQGKTGHSVLEFTQAEINDKQIWFLHLGTGDSTVTLKLTDGKTSSSPVTLHIQTVKLELKIIKNTGLILPYKSYSPISSHNLTTISNLPSQEVEIRYQILYPPTYGVVERKHYVDGEWHQVSSFVQRHIDNGHIRYRYTETLGTPPSDTFKFRVEARKFTTPIKYFNIQFEDIYLTLERNEKLTLMHQPYGVVSASNIKTSTNNPLIQPSSIKYTIVRPPSLGDFYKVGSPLFRPGDNNHGEVLRKDTVFSQQDIDDEKILYKLKTSSYEKVNDFAELEVQITEASGKLLRFWIEYIPGRSGVRFINNGLSDVIEGGLKAIDKHSLYIRTDNFNVFEYSVTSPPQHGQLQIIDPRSSAVLQSNVDEFTNGDINDLRLVYKHDDSEHDRDSFTFTAVPIIQRSIADREIPEFTGTFEIQMLMRNDNKPVRSVDKVFKVVRNHERLITLDDLAFTDPDIDYNTDDLLYTRRGIPNGDIIHAENRSQIYRFTQKNLKNKEIIFQHRGDDLGRAAIYVTDGQFYTTCLLEIQAGDPYIKITENTGALVKRNNQVTITVHNLSVETNVNADDKDIDFFMIEEPRQGHFEVDGREVLRFSFSDIKKGRLAYRHDGGSVLNDNLKFAVRASNTQAQDSFPIQIVIESVQLPPRVVNNHVLEVFGNGKNIIEQSHLMVSHPDSMEENIEYLVLVLPKHGRLYRQDTELTVDSDMTFTQYDINNGVVTYQLDNLSATTDQFIFEVSNGYEALRGLEFLINIVPTTLTLDVKNFTVREGGKKALSPKFLIVDDKFVEEQTLKFIVKKAPIYGIIEFSSNKGTSISTFSIDDVKRGIVYYAHDDSDSTSDQFTLVVASEDGSQESEDQVLQVTIDALNDEAPVIVNNKGLVVWMGSMTQLTSGHLLARDPDTGAAELEYRVSMPTNGHLSVVNNTFKPIFSFTQAWIDDGIIVFVHTGGDSGDFSFQVSDGYNQSPLSNFHIEAKKLVLTLDTNSLLNAYPNTIQPITVSHLSASTNDPQQSKPIVYVVSKKPQHGVIVTYVTGKAQEITTFTQEEINASQVFYKHEEKLNGWTQNDSAEFKITTIYAEALPNKQLDIYISYGNLNAENKNQLIRTSPIHVDEGGEMIVAKNNLDVSEFVKNLERLGKRVSLRFSLKDPPHYGELLYRNEMLLKGTRFGQRNINSHALMYKHDDSNTIFDTFNLTLHLRIQEDKLPKDEERETTFMLILNVTIQPINDEPFKLLTTNPVLNITQGFKAFINRSVLHTVDEDTLPAYLVYKIIRRASNGHVAYIENAYVAIETFTQQDINDGKVIFVQDGSIDSSAFSFQVSDGVFRPLYNMFNVTVTKIYMNITQNDTVTLTQSDSSVQLTQVNLNVSTNGLRRNVTYYIRKKPRFGQIYLNGRDVLSFTQADVDNSGISYFQENMKSGYDYFMCDIKYRGAAIIYTDRFIHIKVKPLLTEGPLNAPKGEKVAITLLSLDAGKLSERTADNPEYSVIKGPYYGKLVKKAFAKRQVHHDPYKDRSGYKSVQEFSHEDVVYMKIFYESDIYTSVNSIQDNFTYILSAFNVQPAEGVFYVGLEPSEYTPVFPVAATTIKPSEPVTSELVTQSVRNTEGELSPVNDESVEPSSLKHEHMLVLAIVIPLLVLLILAVLVVFLLWRRRRKRDYAPSSKRSPHLRPHISGPYQIQQPHVHIEPQEPSSPSEEMRPVVEYANACSIAAAANYTSEEADIVMPMMSHDPHYIPRSPDVSRTEISATVPTCKVTPLIDNDASEDDIDLDLSPDDVRKSNSSMGDMIEWITSDPELLQHCSSSSPPVLRKNQYWV